MEQIKEHLRVLASELGEHNGPSGMADGMALRQRASLIAGIALRHCKGELMHRCLDIATAIADFAEELEEPSD